MPLSGRPYIWCPVLPSEPVQGSDAPLLLIGLIGGAWALGYLVIGLARILWGLWEDRG